MTKKTKIVKWTTITEDESTWPPNNANFSVNPIKWFLIYLKDETIRSYRDNEHFCFDINVNNPVKIKDCIGTQWRPIPNPPKKKTKAEEETIEVKRLFLEECLSILKKQSKSPWKPGTEKPTHKNEVFVRGKLYTGEYMYGIGCIFRGEWQWNSVSACPVLEWMEIPE